MIESSIWQEANETILNQHSCRAAGKFINELGTWQLFITLTFRFDISETKAHRLFHLFFKRVAKRFREHLDVAWCWGPQKNGRIHFHALVKTRFDSKRVLRQRNFWGTRWPGNCEFEPPRDQEKSSYYLAKREHLVWEFNVACPKPPPCKRKNRFCIVAPYPWPKPSELMHL